MSAGKHSRNHSFSEDDYWTTGQHQASGTRLLLWISLLAIGSLLLWASLAEIDEMVKGEGKVVPSQQVQVIQSLDGGVIEDILVRQGQHVEPGQILLRIDPTRYSSSLGENRAEALALAAKAARLEAIANGQPFVAPPQVLKEAPQLIELETRIWETKTRELEATVDIAREQYSQREQEAREARAKRDQSKASCDLTSRELQVTRPLLKTG
ncbi:MAG TPA: biotin/lipoyl-binding protein, partial [Castellaniella sp.]|nr:biotin/lipoyl-binding protein [Castellaniella sp.]